MTTHPCVLVVDDDQTLLKIVHDILISEGFSVITATDASSALSLLAERNPDLVLLDIIMPKHDGYETLKMIRLRSSIPVIMLTCVGDETSMRRTMGYGGADGYIIKPVSSRVLVAQVKAKLRRAEGKLRLSTNAATPNKQKTTDNEHTLKRNKILVVDDDERILQVVGDMLTPNGYDVLLVKDGAEAVTVARNEQPELILMDILMPNVDGYTACSILKSDEKTKQIPLVMLTAVGHELNKRLSEELNADGYLVKPISLDLLLDMIDRFLKS